MRRVKKIVYLQGGLGNQMFQYAFYLAIKGQASNAICSSSLVNRNRDHNGYELGRVFNIKCKDSGFLLAMAKIMKKLTHKKSMVNILNRLGISLIMDTIPSYYMPHVLDPVIKPINVYLGYWQTELYFKGLESQIRHEFSFSNDLLSVESKNIAEAIKSSNSVSVHIRRGDYLLPKYQVLYGNICTLDYYRKAIALVMNRIVDCKIFIFSDDIDWVKVNLNVDDATFIDFNRGQDSWQDMFLMSICKHNIIANSTFSWWGAWLNTNPDKVVICPSRFLNVPDKSSDIIPEDWIKL